MHSTILSDFPGEPAWRADRQLAGLGREVIASAARRFAEARPGRMALTLLLPHKDGVRAFSHRGGAPGYPASLVKPFFMVAAHARLQAGKLGPSRELEEALAAMIRHSSNDATSLVVDLLTGTTSGPALPPDALARWLHRRRSINRYFAGWRRPELAGINLAQKTWYEAPYGREHQSCFGQPDNRNRLTCDAVALLLLALARGEAVSRRRSAAMLRLMARDPGKIDHRDPWNQMTGFLGQGLPAGARLWSKAGWSSRTRHDAAIIELPDGPRLILVAMTFGKELAANRRLLPFIARAVGAGVRRIQKSP
jgi:hypothetical protein